MNPTQKRKGTRTSAKGKSRIQLDLVKARDTLKRRESELISYQEELQHARAELRALEEELQTKSSSSESQAERLRKIEEENAELREQLRAAEENVPIQLDTAKRETRASEQKRFQLEERIKELEKTIDSLKERTVVVQEHEDAVSERIPSPKASFRLDLYPHQGHYQGRIMNLLDTKNKKAFTGVDGVEIIEFISRHLPEIREEVGKTEPDTIGVKRPPDYVEKPIEAEGIPGQLPRLSDLKIIPIGAESPSISLRHDQPFEVYVNFDLTDVVLPRKSPLEQTVTIYAKPMEGGPRQTVGKVKGPLAGADQSSLKVFGTLLPKGTYRLEASVIFSGPTEKPVSVPQGSFLEGSIFYVL